MLKKVYIKRIFFSLGFLIILCIASVYVWSAFILQRSYPIPLSRVQVPHDPASQREGERFTHIAHCSHCHGDHFSGGVVSKTNHVEFIGPNITRIIPGYSDEELERLIRYGVKKDGHSVYIMPSDVYFQLKEVTVEKIIAYLRTLKPIPSTAGIPGSTEYDFLGRLQLIEGKFTPIADEINHIDSVQFTDDDTTSVVSFGKYLARTSCGSCHGKDLKGRPGFSPDLVIAQAYTRDQFLHLLQTGEGLGRRNLGMMSDVAKNNLCYLHDNEMSAIYAYLKTSPTRGN